MTTTTYHTLHHHRVNLLVHALTVPMFMAGSVATGAALVGPWWLALVGLAAMITAVGAQGLTHRLEHAPPFRFAGPLDFARVLFVEQWLNFPRYVLTGGFRREWRR
jgi:hypothetical protein